MEDKTNNADQPPVERRSGEDRRKFSFGYIGRERRKGPGRRKEDRPQE